jgi:hypothetical protein
MLDELLTQLVESRFDPRPRSSEPAGELRTRKHRSKRLFALLDRVADNRPMDGDERGTERLRSFLVGGVLGASAVIAAARRRHPRSAARHAAGLAAFEDAPCYRETIEREAITARGAPAPDRR